MKISATQDRNLQGKGKEGEMRSCKTNVKKLTAQTPHLSGMPAGVTPDDSLKVPCAVMHPSWAAEHGDATLSHRNDQNLQRGNSIYTTNTRVPCFWQAWGPACSPQQTVVLLLQTLLRGTTARYEFFSGDANTDY